MNTPDNIEQLEPGQVFVFGSHATGHHAGGAARYAVEHFGALIGQGEGPQGSSYGIPTMGSFPELEAAVSRFLDFATVRPEVTFLITKIGTGIAGWPISEIAPLFKDHPTNVVLPIEFEAAS